MYTYENVKCINVFRSEHDLICVGIRGRLQFYESDDLGSWLRFVLVYRCELLLKMLLQGCHRMLWWKAGFYNGRTRLWSLSTH